MRSGAGIILRRLLHDYPLHQLYLLTSSLSVAIAQGFDPIPPPSQTETAPQFRISLRFVNGIVRFLDFLMIPLITWKGASLARKKSVSSLLTFPWSPFFVAAFFIHKLTRIPLHVYVMDDPLGMSSFSWTQSLIYRALMPRILRAAKTVWGVSAYTCENLQQRFGVPCLPLLPPVDVEDFRHACQARPESQRDAQDESIRIVYTGSVYAAQLDALKALVDALNGDQRHQGTSGRPVRLTLYTDRSRESLQSMGLYGPAVHSSFVNSREIPRVLASADILFLPFSFLPENEHITRTSFPTKIAEYLAGGVPILVHAPAYATVTRYCRENHCALVVDEPDPAKLLAAVSALYFDRKLKEDLSTQGVAVARKNHERAALASRLLSVIASE
jgi:glycosyltransferase involved in cell wall biosynthesis